MKEIVGNRLCWDPKRHRNLAKIIAITKVLIYLSTKCDFLLGLRFGNTFCRFNTHLPWLICHRWVVPNEWSVKIFGNQITFRRQAIIRINAGILLIEPLWTKFSEMHAFSLKTMHLKMSSAKWQSFCLGLNVFKIRRKRDSSVSFAIHAFICIGLRTMHYRRVSALIHTMTWKHFPH